MLNKESLANVDKRVGSIIYDAVAPVCMELAEAYVQLDILESGTFLQSATGSLLEKRVWDYGLTRQEATNAQRIATFYKYKRDAMLSATERYSNIPHFPVTEGEQKRMLNKYFVIQPFDFKNDKDLFEAFDKFSRPDARIFSLLTMHEINKSGNF